MVDIDERPPVVRSRAARVGRGPETPGTTFAVADSASMGRLLPEWAALADVSTSDNPFFHPGFAVPAMAHLDRAVAIATVRRRDGQLVAAAPFTRERLGRIVPAVRLWSHKYAPLGTPLVADGDVAGVAAALIGGLAPADSGRSVVVPDVPLDDSVVLTLIEAARNRDRPVDVVGRHLRVVLDRPEDGVLDLHAALPTRRRKEIQRQFRRLADLGDVTVETATAPEAIRPAFETFLALENAGWKGRAGTALAASPATAAFVRSAVASRAAASAVRIDSLARDRRPVAMLVTFIAGATAFTWKIAYDEAFARFSPGAHLMLEVAPRIFAETAVRRIDSLADTGHPMIDRLWPGRMSVGTLVIGPPGGSLLHRAGLVAARLEAAARVNVKRLRR
jgi:CelD/BcsL family acetyltransferase involved in cellulose biosynthesis